MNKFLYIFLVFCFVHANSILQWYGGGSFFQLSALIICVILILMAGAERITWSVGFFVCACVLSIAVNTIPAFFKPWERMGQFLLIIIAFSPLLNGLNNMRKRFFFLEIILLTSAIISVMSFFNRLAGGGYVNTTTGMGFTGWAFHPNFLGFFCMFTIITSFILFFSTTKKKQKILFGGILVASLIAVLLSAARICVAGSIMGCMVFVYFRFRRSFSKLLKVSLIISGISFVSFPILEPYLVGIMYKQNAAKEAESSTSSRDLLWATRLEEFRRYPIWGVGCFAVDTSIPIEEDERFFNPYDRVKGTVELGSTYLGVLSQMGLVGIITFGAILILAFYRCLKMVRETDSFVAIGLMSFFVALCVHMIVEGYATQAGSVQCLLLWLLIGCLMSSPEAIYEEEDRLVYALALEDDEDSDDEGDEEEEEEV